MALIRPVYHLAKIRKAAVKAVENIQPAGESQGQAPEGQEPEEKVSTQKRSTKKTK